MKYYRVIATAIATAICSAVVSIWLVAPLRQAPIYRIDLSRLALAQASLSQGAGGRRRPRMVSLTRVREVIHRVAGTHLVLPSEVVIQGATDITPVVLAQLGLPLAVPDLRSPRGSVTPRGLLP